MNHVVHRCAIGFLFSAIVGCPESHAPWPTLGQLSDSDPTILVHISANTFAPSTKIRRNGIEFSCGVDPGTAAIIYVETFDNDFRTPENVVVHETTLASLLAVCGSDESGAVIHEEGYCFYVCAPVRMECCVSRQTPRQQPSPMALPAFAKDAVGADSLVILR